MVFVIEAIMIKDRPVRVTVKLTRGALVLFLALAPSLFSQGDEVMRAMKDEMDRSLSGLRMENQPAPYYIAYSITDVTNTSLRATAGAPVEESTNRTRSLRVDVRVGSYDFDSSRFISLDREAGLSAGAASCTLEDNYEALRRQIWLATDAAYKRAVSAFSKKKAVFQNRIETEPIPDFSKETPREFALPVPAPTPVGKEWSDAVRRISAEFVQIPEIFSSEVGLSVSQGKRYFLNSEGFKAVTPLQSAALRVLAETQAEDGSPLRDFFTSTEKTVQDLLPAAELSARARELAANLVALRKAPVGEDYSGPVMVEGQAAAELLAQTFVSLFLSLRLPEADNPSIARIAQMQVTPFLTRIGSRILPESISVTDTPSLSQHNKAAVAGAYAVDEEGIAAQDVTLVKDGRLQALLTSRTPQKNLLQSNGHGRGGGAQAGVFQVQSSAGIPTARMKEKYLEELKQQNKPFGYIIQALANPTALRASSVDSEDILSMAMAMAGPGGQRQGPQILRAVKITVDGKEEPVRGLYLSNISHSSFKDILHASEERTLYNYRATSAGLMGMIGLVLGPTADPSGSSIVSLIAPNLIFEELEVQRGKDVSPKLPIVPSPLK